jgi:putative ABC transport system permease protein
VGPRASFRRALAPALAGIRAYWGTAALAAATGAIALGATLPVAALAAFDHGVRSRLHAGAAGPFDAGFLWLNATGPAQLRQDAVTFLFQILLGVAVGLMVVALLTLASLFVARASARGPEIAIRRAVGASSRVLVAAQLVEGAILAAGAVLAGEAIGRWGAQLAQRTWPGGLGAGAGGPSEAAVLVVAAALVLGALLPVALVRRPARSSAVDPTPLALVVPAAQLGLSLTVLAAAAQVRLGADRLAPPAPAMRGGGEVYEIGAPRLPLPQRAGAYAALLARLHADHTVSLASLSSPGAQVGLGWTAVAGAPCRGCVRDWMSFYAVHHLLSADSFKALGLRVITGRAFTDADGWSASRVAVVSRTLTGLLGAGPVIGKKIWLGYGPDAEHTVVGVVDDVAPRGLGGTFEPREVVYASILQHPPATADLVVRGDSVPPVELAVRRALAATLGPAAAPRPPVSETGVYLAETAPLRWFGRRFGGEGWSMLAVATFGTFAIMWLWVASLLGELGVRRATGARRGQIARFVLARAAAVAVAGIAFGSWVGMMVWDGVHARAASLPAWDPKAVVWSGILLGGAALAGALLPAWRASRTPPATLIQGGEGLA